MSTQGPMEKYMHALGPAIAAFEEEMQDVDFRDLESGRRYIRGLQELQLHNWAAGMAAGKRHGLLKKIMEEVR